MSSPLEVIAGIVGRSEAQNIVDQLDRSGLMIVPKEPSQAMIDAAWAAALAEKAEDVWRDMIEAYTNQ
jgi:hypothetical protein